jgi:hypothetical protein
MFGSGWHEGKEPSGDAKRSRDALEKRGADITVPKHFAHGMFVVEESECWRVWPKGLKNLKDAFCASELREMVMD